MATWSGLWDNVHGEPHALIGTRNANERHITRQFRKPGMRVRKELFLELNGAAAGATALVTRTQVTSPVDRTSITVLGGLRSIETVTDINRATTAADETYNDAVIDGSFALATAAVDKAGFRRGVQSGF